METETHNSCVLSRREMVKQMVRIPLLGYSTLHVSKLAASAPLIAASKPSLSTVPPSDPDSWYPFCRPILEWLNPHPNLDVPAYVESLIQMAKDMNVNTLYHLIDFGGAPLFNGSIEPKSDAIGNWDLIEILERRLHEEGMYFVGAQFGSHTQSSIAARHPDWIAQTLDGDPVYGPGAVPLICFNSPYGDYVADELSRMVARYKTDGLYIEGLHTTHCFCKHCRERYQDRYGANFPEKLPKGDMKVSRFHMDTVVEFIEKITLKVKTRSPSTVVMACPSANNGPNGRVDWKGLSEVCDVICLEQMWGYGIINFPLWQIGMRVGVMFAEGKKPCFTTAWYSMHVDREYTPRSGESVTLNYLESIIHGGTAQFHTQNGPGEAPDNIPVLRMLYTFTEKVRPWMVGARKIHPVALLYDRDHAYPDSHFIGYYKAMVHHHVPFCVISRDELHADFLSRTQVLVLPNTLRISDDEAREIRRFVEAGGRLVATYKTGFQKASSNDSILKDTFGVRKYTGQEQTAGKPTAGEGRWSPEYYRKDWNFLFRCSKDSCLEKACRFSLLTFRGPLLKVVAADPGIVAAHKLEVDKARQSWKHPVLGFYPGLASSPMVLERPMGRGTVVYLPAAFELDYLEQGSEFTGKLLAAVLRPDALPIRSELPSTVEMTCYLSPDSQYFIIHLLNQTSNQHLNPDDVREILPVYHLKLLVKGGESASSLLQNQVLGSCEGADLVIVIPELKQIDTIMVKINELAVASLSLGKQV
jgi:hypothetical protein